MSNHLKSFSTSIHTHLKEAIVKSMRDDTAKFSKAKTGFWSPELWKPIDKGYRSDLGERDDLGR